MVVPLTVRQDSPIAVGNGISEVALLMGLKLAPNTAIREPGATGTVRSAAFTTRSMLGGATGVSKFQDRAVNPDTVRAIRVFRLAKGANVRVNTEAPPEASGCSATRVGRIRSLAAKSKRWIVPPAP